MKEAQLRAVFENAGVGIAVSSLEGRFLEANPCFCQVLGYSAEALNERTFLDVTHPDDVEATRTRIQDLLAGRITSHKLEKRYVRGDGRSVWCNTSVSLLRGDDGSPAQFIGVVEDITHRKEAEQALKAQADMLRLMDQRKDEFLATLSHELRNPLAPIKQAAVIAATVGATEDQKRWATEVIGRQVQNMSLLLDDLLDVSRITRGTLELRIGATDLFGVIKAAVETSQPLIDVKRHRLEMELPRDPVRFAADPLRIAQVLSNLLTNAAKYTDAGGKIRLVAKVNEQNVTLRVEDNGIGVAAESMAWIFRLFSQVAQAHERSEGGLGIGLALAKGLTELHGGTLSVESPGLGHGSTFIVTLPRSGVVADTGSPMRVSAENHDLGKRRVLVADDNRDAANSLAMLLRMEGHEVEVVHDGISAIEGIRAHRPDVAILDIGMPGMDGYEVARLAREAFPDLTLVAVTGWGQKNDIERAMASGFDHHFTKPIEPSSLTALLEVDE
jgi:PAS domain S-box-containing protein